MAPLTVELRSTQGRKLLEAPGPEGTDFTKLKKVQKKELSMRTFWVVVNLLSMTSFLTLAMLLTFWPGHLSALHLSTLDAQVVLMELISLLLLLAFLHRNLSRGWRWFTLAGSFLVLSESILMSGLYIK